jgi:hypothetical protein
MSDAHRIFHGGARAIKVALAVATAGAVLLVVGAIVDPTQFFCSYLIAFAFVASTAAGALILLMIVHAMRAGWPTAVRRLLEGMVGAFPMIAVLFLPLCFGLSKLYPWLHPEGFDDAERQLVLRKLPYLNIPFFLARTALFFLIWLGAAWLLRRWSFQGDRDASADVNGKLYRFSAGALPAVALATSFAAFDWLMSLTPTWFSTMYPVVFFGGGFVASIAALSAATLAGQRSGFLPGISDSHYYALGRLLLAFTVFWAYATFFQFMLIWMGNRPDEASFYVARSKGAWLGESVTLIVGHFLLPFLVLLNYRLKRQGRWVATIGAWILIFHYVDVHWLVAPATRAHAFPVHWLDLPALFFVGGLTFAAALVSLRDRPLVPIHDPRLDEALRYESV